MPLTQETIDVIKATAPVVAEHALEITTTFYKTMFENNPEVLAFFNKSHQRHGKQPRALADAVVAYAVHIEHLDKLGPLVARMAHRHVALSVKPEHYAIVHKNLMIAIGKVLGAAVTPEIANAWSDSVLALAEICIGAEEELYKANESRKGGWRYEREFELVSKDQVAADTVAFEFKPIDGYEDGFDFEAGQYITVRCEGLKEAPRHYTIVSAPGEKTIKICTRKVPHGAMSTYMHDKMTTGDKVLLGAPCGVFTPAAEEKDAKVVLLSAGIGITPMLAFLQHYGSDAVKAAIHVEKSLERDGKSGEFAKAGVKDVTIVYTQDTGRPEAKSLCQQVVEKAGKDAIFYICGPTDFLADFTDAIRSQQIPEENIRSEVFGTGTVKTTSEAEHADSNQSTLPQEVAQGNGAHAANALRSE